MVYVSQKIVPISDIQIMRKGADLNYAMGAILHRYATVNDCNDRQDIVLKFMKVDNTGWEPQHQERGMKIQNHKLASLFVFASASTFACIVTLISCHLYYFKQVGHTFSCTGYSQICIVSCGSNTLNGRQLLLCLRFHPKTSRCIVAVVHHSGPSLQSEISDA